MSQRRFRMPWPVSVEQYRYILGLAPCGLAWEFLRRNPDYQRDWRLSSPGQVTRLSFNNGWQAIRLRRRYRQAEVWGLKFFADPRESAQTAETFWYPDVYGRTLAVLLSTWDGVKRPSLKDCSCHKSLLITAAGRWVARLSADRLSLQLSALESLRLSDKLAILPVITDMLDTKRQLRLLQEFSDLFHDALNTHRTRFGSLKLQNCLEALVALDGHLAGASYREIAKVIVGEDRVEAEWHGGQGALKTRIVRAVKRGRALMAGGYKDLLSY